MDDNFDQPTSPSQPKPDRPFQASADRPRDPSFGPMVWRAVIVGIVGWIVKVGSMLRENSALGGIVHIRKWGPGIPYLAFEIRPEGFIQITSKSTVTMAFAMLAMLVNGLLKNKSRIHVAGWCFAPISLAYTLAFDFYMQVRFGSYTDLDRLGWAVGVFALSCVLVAWWIAIERPHSALQQWRQSPIVTSVSP
jgi:hypothetical protein